MGKNGQTVSVLDERNTVIGYTYPKRAKGLVKKRRAEFVSDNAIRLHRQCPTYENMEDMEMNQIHYITVNPSAWHKNPDENGLNVRGPFNRVNDPTVCERFMIDNPLANDIASLPRLTEVLSVGSWNWDVTSYIAGNIHEIEPDSEYHFVFWLNGGENDRSDETCQLQILFTATPDPASRGEFYAAGLHFRLNRGYIKPLKKYNGWEYYDIPFTTPQTGYGYVQFQLVADRAPMALIDAREPELYKDLPDLTDPYVDRRPQRHNIFFEDGWPVDKWYSTTNLAHEKRVQAGPCPPIPPVPGTGPVFPNLSAPFNQSDLAQNIIDEIMGEIDVEDLQEEIKRAILDGLDMDAIRKNIVKSLNLSN